MLSLLFAIRVFLPVVLVTFRLFVNIDKKTTKLVGTWQYSKFIGKSRQSCSRNKLAKCSHVVVMDAALCTIIQITMDILTFVPIACGHFKIANFINKTHSLTCIFKYLDNLLSLALFLPDRSFRVRILLVLVVSLILLSIYRCFHRYIWKLCKIAKGGGLLNQGGGVTTWATNANLWGQRDLSVRSSRCCIPSNPMARCA